MKRTFIYSDAKSNKFWSIELSADGKSHTVTYGKVGTAGQTLTKDFPSADACSKSAEKLIAEKTGKGYVEQGGASAVAATPAKSPVVEKPAAKAKSKSAAAPSCDIVPFSQIKSEIKVPISSCAADERVKIFSGDTHFSKNLELDYDVGLFKKQTSDETPIAGIIVRGNLTIDGALLNFEDDYGPFLIVTGNLKATSVATGGSTVHIMGNLTTQEVVGVYNHGYTQVDGTVTARAVISEHSFSAGKYDTEWTWPKGGANDITHNARNGRFEANGVLASGLASSEGTPHLDKVRERLAKAKPVLRPVFTSILDKVVSGLAKKLENPEAVKNLSLKLKDLPALPEEIFRFRNLEVLDLTHNKLRKLPDEIGLFTNLRQLILNGNRLTCLPDSIGKLTKLEYLSLEANCIASIPNTIAHCVELRTIIFTNNPQAYVRKAFDSWEELCYLESIPNAIARLPKLENLYINQTLVSKLPAEPFVSKTLQKIDASRGTLLTQVPAPLAGILETDIPDNMEKPIRYIGGWFQDSYTTFYIEETYNAKTGKYDFSEPIAIVRHLLHLLSVVGFPAKAALAKFKEQVEEIAENYEDERLRHDLALFAALRDAMDELGKPYPKQPFIGELKALFAKYAGK